MSSARILIVDDDTALLQALPQMLRLRMEGIAIDTCDSASAALEQIARTDYDAIVSDIKMPGMNGLNLLAKIIELRPDTPTLLITALSEHDLAIQALRGGAYDCIQKPLERDYLVASLLRALQVRQLRRRVEEQRLALERHAAELEEAIQERTRELVEANAAKDTFLSIASHELRTPLTSLKALAQIAHQRLLRARAPETLHLEKMQRAIGRMEMLVDDLIDVSRIEAGKLALRLESADLGELCRRAVEEQRAVADRAFTLKMPEQPLPIYADSDRIGQVLTNLLSNAVKFSPETAPVALTVKVQGNEAVVCVRDRGDGIPAERLPHIFERFYQAPETDVQTGSKIGLGLGLYISREIVERHKGRIWAESAPEKGSTFYLTLPLLGAMSPVSARRTLLDSEGSVQAEP
jgi:signal transduction histidine kinase